jgi:phosphatidylglycerophosphate synthase
VAGALCVHACSVLDGVDGEVARLRLRASARGAMLDGILDRAVDAALMAGLGLWALEEGTSAPRVVLLVVAATAFSILSMASKDRIAALALFPAPERALGWLGGGRDGRLLIVAVAAALGHPVGGLTLVAATSGAALALRTALVLRRAR